VKILKSLKNLNKIEVFSKFYGFERLKNELLASKLLLDRKKQTNNSKKAAKRYFIVSR